MSLTSDSLFHFTKSLDNMKSILVNKFKMTYCKEEFKIREENHSYYFPMITFCDMPLSLTKDHIRKYGSYAIGLSKAWGIAHRLNPVVYLEKDSIVAEDLVATLNALHKLVTSYDMLDENGHLEPVRPLIDSTMNLLRYIKNYQGDLVRGEEVTENYRFYDEREWRFVPAWNDERIDKHIIMSEEDFRDYRGDGQKPLLPGITLDFNSKDIKYLIVKEEGDIPELINFIRARWSATTDEAAILTTKIMTVSQLESDF